MPLDSVNPILSGKTTVAAAGTAVVLSSYNIVVEAILVKAASTNTGVIYVGNDGLDTVSSSTGFELDVGEVIEIDKVNLSEIYIDAAVDDDYVTWVTIR